MYDFICFRDRLRSAANVLSEMFALRFTWHNVKAEFISGDKHDSEELHDITVVGNNVKLERLLNGNNDL